MNFIGFDSPMRELDSTANSPRGSLLNDDDDEETMDSDEIVDPKSSFIFNKTHDHIHHRDQLIETDDRWKTNYSSKEVYNALDDIVKDAKTSNANFLVNQQECNNEIHYDSQKFPKDNVRRMALDNSNLTENHDFDNKSLSIKRIKEVNVQKSNCSLECASSGSDSECDSGLEKCNVKRMRLEDHEKNHRRDGIHTSDIQCMRLLQNGECGAIAAQDEVEADKHWAKHLRSNRSVIVDTFQGQFKSTVSIIYSTIIFLNYEFNFSIYKRKKLN